MLDGYAVERQAKQKVEKVEKVPMVNEKRTTLSLSLTVRDKKVLKMMAANKETTIAALIHEWISEHLEEEKVQ